MTDHWFDRLVTAMPHACRIDSLKRAECEAIVNAIANGETNPAPEAKWLLAHCDDGVIWGESGTTSTWRLSCKWFPDESPQLIAARVQQLRLFGQNSEVLVWRTDDGLVGRKITDAISNSIEKVLLPADETVVLVGDRAIGPSNSGFTKVGDATGSSHIVPFECDAGDFEGERGGQWWPLRLLVRHFFAHDNDAGTVRVAASRLVDLWKEKPHVSSGQSS